MNPPKLGLHAVLETYFIRQIFDMKLLYLRV